MKVCYPWVQTIFMLILLSGFTSLFLKPEKARDFWCPGEIIQIDAQITFYINPRFGLRRLSFDEVKDRGSVIRGVQYHETLEKDKPVLFLEEPDHEYLRPYKCVISGRFEGSYHGDKEKLHFSHMNKSFPYLRKYYEVYHALNIGKILPSLILHDGIINCVITIGKMALDRRPVLSLLI